MSLVEVMMTLVVLSVAAMGFLQVLLASNRATDVTRAVTTAKEAARQTIETLRAAAFAQVFALYNADPDDDPDGAGTAPGSGIDVYGLTPLANDPDGKIGEIVFPTAKGAPGELREDDGESSLGMPRDLNGDGKVDAANHAGDYGLLPVLVRFNWQGSSGPCHVQFRTMLAKF